jgi:hypothetical protein
LESNISISKNASCRDCSCCCERRRYRNCSAWLLLRLIAQKSIDHCEYNKISFALLYGDNRRLSSEGPFSRHLSRQLQVDYTDNRCQPCRNNKLPCEKVPLRTQVGRQTRIEKVRRRFVSCLQAVFQCALTAIATDYSCRFFCK